MGFAEGFAAGSSGMRGALQYGLDKERQDKELALRDEEAARIREEFGWRRDAMNRENTSVGQLEALSRGGALRSQSTGMDNDSAAMLASQGYGDTYGADAVRSAAGDMNREQARMGLQRTVDPTADVSTRRATPLEMNQAAMNVALARRDMATWQTLHDKNRTLFEDDILAKKFKEPDNPDDLKWINTNHQSVTIGAPDKNGISRMSVVTPSGEATFAKLDATDRAKVRGAVALMEHNPERALKMIGEVNKDLAATIAADNNMTVTTGKSNNEGAFQSGSLNNQRVTAGAAASTAAAHAAYYGQLTSDAKDNRADTKEARKLAEDFDNLSAKDQAGPPGVALQRRFNMLNAKPGQMVPLRGDAAAGKIPATLSDAQKIAYTKAVDEISMMVPDKTTGVVDQSKVVQIYRKYGLDPAIAGVQALPSWGEQPGAQPGGQAAPALGLQVPNRPFYNAQNADLQRLASKPRGVSTEEANAARMELESRRSESRMGAY